MVLFLVVLLVRRHLTQKRGPAMAAFAKRHGLKYSPGGPSDMRRYDFPLFKKGVERGFDNRMWGEWHDLHVRGGDYWFYKESIDDQGHTSRSYSYFSLALVSRARRPGLCRALRVDRAREPALQGGQARGLG